MIFVTVGTHEQQFNRLVEYMDKWSLDNDEDVVIQTGFSTYQPVNCTWKKLYPYSEMVENMKQARIVITHGGPSSFIMALQYGKVPVVVPRKKEFKEHVNDHQADFCNELKARDGSIIVVNDINELGSIISSYDEIVSGMNGGISSNNEYFCCEFGKVINDLLE